MCAQLGLIPKPSSLFIAGLYVARRCLLCRRDWEPCASPPTQFKLPCLGSDLSVLPK